MDEVSKTKKILFYISSLDRGGAERVFVNLAEFFYANGYDVTMVTTYQHEDEYDLNKGIPRILSEITKEEEKGSRIGNLLARIHKLQRIFEEVNPDLIMTCNGKTNMMALAGAKHTRAKVILSVIADPRMEYYTKAMEVLAKTYFAKADGIVVQTPEAAAYFPKGIQKLCKLLPNSLNPAFAIPRFEGERRKEIVMVGRLDDNKNQGLLIEAFHAIHEKFPEYTVSIYGDGERKGQLQRLIANLALEEKVFLRGRVSDVADRIKESALFVMTSFTEGMPNALIEAMALGLPVICSDCPSGGPRMLIEDGKNGLLVWPGDLEELTKALLYMLSDTKRMDAMGQEAGKIQEKLKPEIVNAQWKDYFDEIMRE